MRQIYGYINRSESYEEYDSKFSVGYNNSSYSSYRSSSRVWGGDSSSSNRILEATDSYHISNTTICEGGKACFPGTSEIHAQAQSSNSYPVSSHHPSPVLIYHPDDSKVLNCTALIISTLLLFHL